ncbi:MAG: glycosyltransferase family 2 protein [Sphingobacteriia bacterium]|nr:glycosyltransferase family 2 protein [Sphingobacteriia bacterium]
MSRLPISVFIIAKNEEERIGKVINSVIDFVDEVIVIDSGSVDNTVKLSESLGAKVIFNEWQGYEKQKIFGEELCKNNWILNIDADEEVSSKLKLEIINLFEKSEPLIKAYRIPITIVHRFDKEPRLFAPTNSPIRFYHKAFASFSFKQFVGESHDSVIIDPTKVKTIGKFKNKIYHRSLLSIKHAVEKANFVSEAQARDLMAKGRCPSSIRIILEIFTTFFKAYIFRRYFVFGINGFIDSLIFAFARFLRVSKAREMWIEKKNNK